MLQSIARALTVGVVAVCSALVTSTPARALDMPDPRTVPPDVALWFAQNQGDILAHAPMSSASMGDPIVYYQLNTDDLSLLESYPDTPAAAYDPSQGRYCAPYFRGQRSPATDEYLCVTTSTSPSGDVTLSEQDEVEIVSVDRETTGFHGQPELLVEYGSALFTENYTGGSIHALNDYAVALFGTPTMSTTAFSYWLLDTENRNALNNVRSGSFFQRNLAYLALAACATALVVWTAYRHSGAPPAH